GTNHRRHKLFLCFLCSPFVPFVYLPLLQEKPVVPYAFFSVILTENIRTDDLAMVVDARRRSRRRRYGSAGKIDHGEGAAVQEDVVTPSSSTHDRTLIVSV